MSLNWLLNYFALRKETARFHIPFRIKGCLHEWKILLKFSLPAMIGGIMVSPVMWLCNAYLVKQPDGFGQMALFDAASQWRAAILFIPGMVGQIILPILSSLNGANDHDRFLKVLKYQFFINGGTTFLITLLVSIFAGFIMKSYGPGFGLGRWVLIYLAFSAVCISLSSVAMHAITSKGLMWNGMLFNIVWAAILISISRVLIQNGFGSSGLAFSYFIAYLSQLILLFIYIYFKLIIPEKNAMA